MYMVASGGHPGFTQCTMWRLAAILDLRNVQGGVWWPSWIYAMYKVASGGHPGFTQCTRCRLVAILDLRNVQCDV